MRSGIEQQYSAVSHLKPGSDLLFFESDQRWQIGA